MEFNRNHWFLFGLLLIAFGIQFRVVESAVLNEKTSQLLAEQLHSKEIASAGPIRGAMFAHPPVSRRTIVWPRWLGHSLMSIGAVLILHSLVMKKPGT